MKKIISIILSLVMMLSFTACGTKAEAGWKEQYDLGVKYVNEAKYEEAILAFTKALEIDPKQAPVYIALAEVYVRQENYTAAQETLDKAITEIGQTDELLAEKENLNDKQTTRGSNDGDILAPSVIPPQSNPAPSADAVPGVVRTERFDYGEGQYNILGYDSAGKSTCQYYYNSDGGLNSYDIYTYDTNGNRVRADKYNSEGYLDSFEVYTYDAANSHIRTDIYNADGSLSYYILNTLDANANCIRQDIYDAKGSLSKYFIWTYNADGSATTTWYNPDGTIME